jgi:DNA-binding HxlR family transcriptional regulator
MNPKQMTPAEKKKIERLGEELLGRVADEWTLRVIDALEPGVLRFSRLRERVGRVSQKMLTQTLRKLERDGLVTRRVYPVVPPKVEYELTKAGAELADAACGIWRWAIKHHKYVDASRRAYERSRPS